MGGSGKKTMTKLACLLSGGITFNTVSFESLDNFREDILEIMKNIIFNSNNMPQ
jgi:hypothetical protein